jgi:hypothetical protein
MEAMSNGITYEYWHAAVLIVFILVGVVVSVLSGSSWTRRRVFHLLPFVYSFAGFLLVATVIDLPFEWPAALVLGIVFYALAWISYLKDRQRNSRAK